MLGSVGGCVVGCCCGSGCGCVGVVVVAVAVVASGAAARVVTGSRALEISLTCRGRGGVLMDSLSTYSEDGLRLRSTLPLVSINPCLPALMAGDLPRAPIRNEEGLSSWIPSCL